MPIDEFGREIPAAGGGGGAPSSSHPTPFADPLRNGSEDRPRSHSRDDHNNDALLDNPLVARRGGGERGNSGGNGGDHRSRSPGASPRGGERESASPRRDNHDNDHHRSGGGGRGGRGRNRARSRGDSSAYDDRDRGGNRRRSGSRGGDGRRNRSRSYGGDNDDREDHYGGGHGRHRGGNGSNSGRSSHGRGSSASGQRKAHASERYSEQPMLCQFLWKKELEEERNKEVKQKGGGEDAADKGDGDTSMDEKEDDNTENNEKAEDHTKSEENKPPPLFETIEAESSAYIDYNKKYCLNYVRTFFNHHLDDPWFRTRLSPLETFRKAEKERTRSTAEANELKKEILQSLEDMNSGVIPKKDPDCADYLGPPMCNFVASCRLGVGTKPTAAAYSVYQQREYYEQQQQENETDMAHNILQGEDRNRIERHAKSHLHSFIKSESCVKIMDVPPNVSDAQLSTTLAEHCSTVKEQDCIVWSDAACIPRHDSASMDPYHRTAYAVFSSSAAKDAVLEGLHKANEEANRHHRDRRPRKGEALPRILDLDVDCTDVYGRREVDADGKGGAPPTTGKKKDADTKLPTKRCTVFVSTSLLSSSQPVSVLSAALSSRERISQDKEDVTTIANVLDEVREIEAGNRLSALLDLLYPGDELRLVDDEDILDISIAYLRRVHLFSFYNGCTAATDVGNVLSFSHPAGTIHLRLRDADDILAKSAEEKSNGVGTAMAEDGAEKEDAGGAAEGETNPVAAKDMLVTRLNDSIAKALEHVKSLADQGSTCLIDPQTDATAHEITAAEQTARQEWTENHGITDEDGRARCSFHFCRKLFKDDTFLHKHLLKKHSDQLRSECAKCHDGPMMAAWDSDDRRPVPPVLMDCGSKFGLIPKPVCGNDKPSVEDPEPELWREESERMAEEERRHREREAAARAAEEEMQRRREVANAGEKRKSNFVDPDDMVEEKVELSFVEVVAPPPKKKKKKKKSLL